MNVFKRKSIYLAVAAAGLGAVGTVGVTGSAAAVTLSQTGTGQVLIYPYYTVRNGTNTLISVANTTASAKSVKVRFLEGKNSREVLDFNLYLSANDMWTAALSANTDGTRLATGDNSCTGLPTGGTTFVNYAYGGTNTAQAAGVIPDPTTGLTGDWESQTLDRTREGYFEIIEMGTIAGASALESAVTHVSGVPRNCAYVNTNSTLANQAVLTAQLNAPSGGLMGNASLVNVASGMDMSMDPVALASFSAVQIWALPGAISPDMTAVNPKTSIVFKNGAAASASWAARAAAVAGSLADPVSAVLMHDKVMNDFVLDSATLSATDWVLTMPTKRHYTAVGSTNVGVQITPFTTTGRFTTGGACEAFTLAYYNREENSPSTPAQPVSPLPPGATGSSLCWESTVLTFNNSGATLSASTLLGSKNYVGQTIDAAYANGWASVTFSSASNTMTSVDGHTYIGLPVVGFMVQDFVNGSVGTPAVLSNYGGNMIHKYRTNIDGNTGD